MSTADANLPQPAHAGEAGPAPTGKGPSSRELQAEIQRARSELGATIDELTTRLSPSYQATQLAGATRTAAQDATAFVTGNGMPDGSRGRNAKILLGALAAGAAAITALVVRRVRG